MVAGVNELMMVSAADYWSARMPGRAVWLTALSPMMCSYQLLGGVCLTGPFTPAIGVGEAFFDTGDRITAKTPARVALCASCAVAEIPDAAFGLD